MTFSFSSRFLLAGLAAVAMAAFAGTARAEGIKFYNANGSTSPVDIYFNVGGTSLKHETTSAGQYNVALADSHGNFPTNPTFAAYCTDLNDNISNGETWDVNPTTVGNGLNYVNSHNLYPGGVNVSASAIDYIAAHYIAPPSQPAAQIAIWDLVEGGHLTKTGNSYTWDTTKFYETGFSTTADLASIYTIEQAALAATGTFGSTFLLVDGYSGGRPQDLVYYNPAGTNSIPEPAFYQMGMFLAGGGLMALRLRRKK